MISVICCYNNEKVYKETLLASLQLQNVDYELIGVSNFKREFPSASAALNYGASQAKGDVLAFCHQDVELLEEGALLKIREKCLSHPTGDVFGIAGNRSRNKKIISNILQEDGKDAPFKTYMEELVEVETVDECLFAMKKETWGKYGFDEETFLGWHLYAVDACLHAKRAGYGVYVMDVKALHRSPGRLDDSYWRDFRKLIQKYKKDFDYITTTCVCSHTNFLFEVKYFIWRIKKLVSWKYL